MSTQRLELTWIGKNHPDYDIANIEPRILIEDPSKSYGDSTSDNMLIHGDNLLALKALLPEYEGKVKCIYIDPPYNTGNAFEHYDDSVEHSIWLSLMKPRLELLRSLLSEDGSIWVSIDDKEVHYLKIIMDEVFGRKNFIASNIWQKRYSRENREAIGDVHEYILTYAKNPSTFKKLRNKIALTEEQAKVYKNPNNDPKWRWRTIPMTAQEGHATKEQYYEVIAPSGKIHIPPSGRCWGIAKATYEKLLSEGRIYFGKDGNSQPNTIRYLSEVEWVAPWTWWPSAEVGHTDESKKEIHQLFGKVDAFDSPKPERLMERIIHIATNKGDLVLDSFIGSGTTLAVAHKMNRRWIGIEMGEHAYTLCKIRLDKIINNEDQWGITESVEWQWGGGYKFYELAPSFITTDEFGNRVIDDFYDDTKLVRAMCKLLGYTFSPSDTEYYKQGVGSGRNYLYVTTQMMSAGVIRQIASHLASDDSLTIATRKYESGAESADSRITIKKIPQSVLKACQYGKKEYLLPIRESAIEEVEWEDEEEATIS